MIRQPTLPRLDLLVRAKLFQNTSSWPATPNEILEFQRLFEVLGLSEQVRGTPPSTRITPLGTSLNLKLLMVFLGTWDLGDVPIILNEHGLIDDLELSVVR